jgi:small subunit ribosomal protein S20
VFNTSSAAKRERQNEKRRMRNREAKSAVRTAIKKFQLATQAQDKDLAKEKFDLAIKLIDNAGSRGVFHSNTVSRKKSRLAQQFNALNKAE